jgi:hypothetical protein
LRFRYFAAATLLALGAPQAVESQALTSAAELGYADLADLALPAPVAVHVRVRRASLLREREAPGVAAGHRRFFVEADAVALIRGAREMPGQVRYLVDLPNDARGRPARIERRSEYLLLATTAQTDPGELRLVAHDAQLPWTPALGERLRAILREAARSDAPPRITAVGRAFHVPGSLPGESETQLFLQAEGDRPVSVSILRRPGEEPRWEVALTEIVDQGAAPPQPNSLLWYRLACTLPPALPPQSLREASEEEARAIRADYAFVLERLGPCGRSRRRR